MTVVNRQGSGQTRGPQGGPGFGPGPGRPGGPMGGMMKGEKARDFRGTMTKLIRYLKPYRVALIVALVFTIASTAAGIFGPRIMGQATTELYEGVMAQISGAGGIDFDTIGRILLSTLGLYLLSAAFTFAMSWMMADISTNLAYRMRREISEKINRLPLKYFDNMTHGEVLSRITNDVDTVNQTFSQSISQIITMSMMMVGQVIMMFSISWLLTLAALIVIPLALVMTRVLVGKSQKYFQRQQEYLGHVNSHVEEMFGGHLVVKAFNGEQKSIERFDTFNTTLYDSAWKAQFLSNLLPPATHLVGNIGYVAVAILGGWLIIQGRISVGDMQAFIQYVRNFTMPITQLANTANVLQQTAAAAERVFSFLEETEEPAETASPVEWDEVQGAVEFDNVHFGYNPDKIVINDFCADIKPGQRIAIVGPTGAGKTTMVKLLMRFYDLNSGEIRVDGHNIVDLTRSGLRDKFGMVLQDAWLYNGTIMDNIRYGQPDATEADVIEAAKTARVDHFIRTLPQGYHTMLNEETTNISQGQMQLLTIARAVLSDPKILILDEATSSVDTRTEVLIQEALNNLMVGRTSFIIAHRLSTIRNADLILVMRDGDIVEQGSQEELLAAGGFYAQLYNSQFEGAEV
jgi:ATP-binding cassette subfamily B multidrug efflux pump